MTNSLQRLLMAVSILAMLPTANAKEPLAVERIIECANEQNDARRLACYDDAVADAKRASRDRQGDLPAAVAQTTPAGALPETAKPAAPPATPASAASPAPVANAATDFGVTGSAVARQRQQEQEKSDEGGKVESITAEVTSVSSKPYGELVITLDNGQVWAQKRKERHFEAKPGDKARIDAGMLGSYRMVIGNRSTHVTRVK